MTEFEQQLASVDKRIERARKRMTGLQAERDAILKNCPHTDIEQKHHYFGGSYYDTSYTDHWCQCRTCGARSEVKTVDHGYYG